MCHPLCAAPPAVQPRWARPPVARPSALQPPSCPARLHRGIPRRRAFEAFDSFRAVGVEPNADTYAALMQASLWKVARRFRCLRAPPPGHTGAQAPRRSHMRVSAPARALPPPCCCCCTFRHSPTRCPAAATPAQGCIESGHADTALQVHEQQVAAGVADTAWTHHQLVDARVVSGGLVTGRWRMDAAPGCVGVLQAVSSAALKAGVPSSQVFQHVKTSACTPDRVHPAADVPAMLAALDAMQAAGHAPRPALLDRCLSRRALQGCCRGAARGRCRRDVVRPPACHAHQPSVSTLFPARVPPLAHSAGPSALATTRRCSGCWS